MMIVDIHCHIPRSPFLQSIDYWVKKWNASDILAVGSMAMNITQSEKNIKLAQDFEIILGGVGVHPWKVKRKFEDEEFEKMEKLISTADIVGEVGLDYRFVKDEKRYPFQQKFLSEILEIAARYRKPISIHCVGADQDMYDLIQSSNIKPELICFHWYSGKPEFLLKFSDIGAYFSINPAIVRSKAHQRVLDVVSKDRWLTESDGNVKYDGVMGEPSIIKAIIFPFLKQHTKIPSEELENLLLINFQKYIGKAFANKK